MADTALGGHRRGGEQQQLAVRRLRLGEGGRRASQRGDAASAPEEVRQPLGQAASSGLLDVEGPGEEVVEGTVAHGHHRAREADDVVGHAEVRRGQAHQQRLRVQPHEVARTLGDWEPGVRRSGEAGPPPHPTHPAGTCVNAHPAAGSCGHTYRLLKRGLSSQSTGLAATTLGTRALRTDGLQRSRYSVSRVPHRLPTQG